MYEQKKVKMGDSGKRGRGKTEPHKGAEKNNWVKFV